MLDTRCAQGRLDRRPKLVTVADLVLAHGHACDGLLRGVWAMRVLTDLVFGDGPIDRSDLLVVSKNSLCLGDVAAYLTGARVRFGTHRLDDTLGVGFQLVQIESDRAFEVREESGYFPHAIVDWEAALLTGSYGVDDKGELLALHEAAQWDWVRDVLMASEPHEHYVARELDTFDPPPALHLAPRTDTLNRTVPAPKMLTSPDDPTFAHAPIDEAVVARWAARYQAGPTSSGTPGTRPLVDLPCPKNPEPQ